MGAWGFTTFDNDDAADWLDELSDHQSLALVRETIAAVLEVEPDEEVDAPLASAALAASELIAAAIGRPSGAARKQEELMIWISKMRPSPDAALIADALSAIDRILGPHSELRALWEESDDYAAWTDDVTQLRARLAF
ncbi:DUF4259 domain-containing protein [Lysobacter capsici]|uniref:DUF4259 domain-containing protein n=1 Tax=Lysobacter capsici AZ78 TaxID=1444315 RepID=A0A108U7V4_9GAMM|nr:DUF4259 domain-containing protein [Lysobacter capsici]ALN84639.1 hypothetical protein LC55x_1348 [Lysobacter capsici]KWS04181.1 hypothetical protein AZ78_1730 [Lysobacter capsici AZ78]UOF16190.1 DUF4259 domain-containing protein [Lysobacter capsici]WND81925.1 DUF4259 domain-containing protein [Lysobacter capsici]WND87121.1 DUF4259 domain-containing protein [Lysobacter capsici]